MAEILHHTLTKTLIGVYFDVYNELGFGFLEAVYERAFALALEQRGLRAVRQFPIVVWYRERRIGLYFADLLIEGAVIVELKAARALERSHESQVLHYLRATDVEVGLLLNFGPKPEFRRLIFTNDRKTGHRLHGLHGSIDP
jgi:GxxExxY protein